MLKVLLLVLLVQLTLAFPAQQQLQFALVAVRAKIIDAVQLVNVELADNIQNDINKLMCCRRSR